MNKNILQFENKEEVMNYLNSLTMEKLILEFNACDNLYRKLNFKVDEVVGDIDVNFRLKILDDLFYNHIENEEDYIVVQLKNLKNYLNKEVDEYLKQIVEYYDDNKLMINSLSYLISCEKKTYKEVILYIYDHLINENHDGLIDRLKKLSYRIKLDIDIIIETLVEKYGFYSYSIYGSRVINKEQIKKIAKEITKTVEYETRNIIDFNDLLKYELPPKQYQLLESTNSINKIGLFNRASIIGIDLMSVVEELKERQIVKIIDKDRVYEFEDCCDYTFAIYINFYSDENIPVLSEIYKKLCEIKDKYQLDEVIIGSYKGIDKEFVILLK